MQEVKEIPKLEILTDKISYDKKAKRITINIFDFTFLGHYQKSTKIKRILNDIHKSIESVKVKRKKIFLVDPISKHPISRETKLKSLKLEKVDINKNRIEQEQVELLLEDKEKREHDEKPIDQPVLDKPKIEPVKIPPIKKLIPKRKLYIEDFRQKIETEIEECEKNAKIWRDKVKECENLAEERIQQGLKHKANKFVVRGRQHRYKAQHYEERVSKLKHSLDKFNSDIDELQRFEKENEPSEDRKKIESKKKNKIFKKFLSSKPSKEEVIAQQQELINSLEKKINIMQIKADLDRIKSKLAIESGQSREGRNYYSNYKILRTRAGRYKKIVSTMKNEIISINSGEMDHKDALITKTVRVDKIAGTLFGPPGDPMDGIHEIGESEDIISSDEVSTLGTDVAEKYYPEKQEAEFILGSDKVADFGIESESYVGIENDPIRSEEVNEKEDLAEEIERLKAELDDRPYKKSNRSTSEWRVASVPETASMPETVSIREDQEKTYDVNMGFQYYPVMMEQQNYLFYVYFSHDELRIEDEEGKTVYKTSIRIVTKKKEPPILRIMIKGKNFEVHPIKGNVMIKKKSVTPPTMIFTIYPLKKKKRKKKDKKKLDRRILHVYVEFEKKMINHTALSITTQPKHFQLKVGPLRINLSKTTAMMVSFISVLIAGISFSYSIISFNVSPNLLDSTSAFFPGVGSLVFLVLFMLTLLKGIRPIKAKWSSFLDYNKSSGMMR